MGGFLQAKTTKSHIIVKCSEKSKFPTGITKYNVKLGMDVTKKECVLPCCTDLYIFTAHNSSHILLHPSVQSVTVTKWYENCKEVDIWFERKCPNFKILILKNCKKFFDWNNNMKQFLLNHTQAKFVYLDFSLEVNRVKPRCDLDFFQKIFRSIQCGYSSLTTKNTWF